MKSVIIKTLFVIFLIFFLNIFLYSESGKCSKITVETIKNQIPVSDFEILSSRELMGLCEIIINVNSRIIPLYGDENYLISGDLFQNKKNVTKDKIYEVNKKIFQENKKALDEVVAFEYKPAVLKSEKTIYMFTEPLCPYCHKAGGEVKKLADKYGISVKVILVSMKGEEGKRKCIEAACRHYIFNDSFNLEQYNQIEWKKEKPDEQFICEKGITLINKTEELSNKMNVDGIPIFYMNNGDYVSGAEMEALELLINQN
ncbi:MAG TPA: thioredoxin fold domain-containing protein [Spirochaetota bacterium]|mgnify:CR=1 FL=1|nr:thioredoxin fold domain-containing protein [Spirochaetota bacterium]